MIKTLSEQGIITCVPCNIVNVDGCTRVIDDISRIANFISSRLHTYQNVFIPLTKRGPEDPVVKTFWQDKKSEW